MIYIDSFYGYFIHFPFIFISAAGRELSRNILTLIFAKKQNPKKNQKQKPPKNHHLTSFFNSKYNLSHKGSLKKGGHF